MTKKFFGRTSFSLSLYFLIYKNARWLFSSLEQLYHLFLILGTSFGCVVFTLIGLMQNSLFLIWTANHCLFSDSALSNHLMLFSFELAKTDSWAQIQKAELRATIRYSQYLRHFYCILWKLISIELERFIKQHLLSVIGFIDWPSVRRQTLPKIANECKYIFYTISE